MSLWQFCITLLLVLTFSACLVISSNQETSCYFDSKLSGEWFQSGLGSNGPVIVNRTHFFNGQCKEVGKTNRYLVYLREDNCYKCMVVNMKHHNIIQYKESFCDASTRGLKSLCHEITGDAILYTMFRLSTQPVKCPFSGPLTFTYSKGYGECSDPVSQVDSCADDSRLLFHQAACPDVPKSESKEEELLCLATWKDGSNRYLAGKINHRLANSDEDRYRCFIFEPPYQSSYHKSSHHSDHKRHSDELWHLSMSADATCQGLVSANEGSITMKLTKSSHTGKRCKFPSWVSVHKQWYTLNYDQGYYIYHHNTSLKIGNGTSEPQNFDVRTHADLRLICHHYESYTEPGGRKVDRSGRKMQHDAANQVTLVVHYTQACRSGYKCMRLHRRDNNAIQVQFGQEALTSEEACSPLFWHPDEKNYVTLLSPKEESVSCGPLGKYQSLDGPENTNNCPAKPNKINLGCSNYDTLELYSDCEQETVQSYRCHSQWESDKVTYIIASPHSRASNAPKRVCFTYRTNDDNSVSADLANAVFSTRHDTCISPLDGAHLAMNVSLVGQCAQASGISSGSTNLLLSSVLFLVHLAILQIVCDFLRGRDQNLR